MATITHDDLLVCRDCTSIVGSGWFDGECEHGDAARHALVMLAEWDDLLLGLTLDHDEVNFSTRPCQGCGSTLAGYRHAAVVLQ